MNQPRGRPFAPGNKLGRGRPKGSRNKGKSPAQDLLDEYALHLTRKGISLAMQGDASALRMCFARITPARQDACIRMGLPRIRKGRDLDKAAEKVTHDIGRGKITPADGEKVMNILKGHLQIMEKIQWEPRLEKLEQNMPRSELPLAA